MKKLGLSQLCLRLETLRSAVQEVRAPGSGATLTVAADVKTDDVRPVGDQPGFANAAIYQFDNRGELVLFHDFAQLRGTQDWQRQSYTFSVHPQADLHPCLQHLS